MDHKLKKMLPTLATSLVVLTSSLSAADDMQVRNLENRVSALEQRRGASGMINPPSRPVVKDGSDLWIQGEALYMQATEDSISYVISSDDTANIVTTSTTGAATTPFIDGRVSNPHYNWNWGFRVGAGYNLPHDGWDMMLNWTWFRSDLHGHKNVEPGQFLFPTAVPPGTSNSAIAGVPVHVDHASVHGRLRLNLLDFEMGREFFSSKWLMFRPHIGLRGAWITRHMDMTYTGGNIAPTFTKLEYDMHNRLRGFGVRGGFDTQWGLGSGWSVFGQVAFSAIYGKQRLHAKYTNDPNSIGGQTNERHDSRQHFTEGARAITDLALGLRWDRLFNDDMYRIRLQGGWEQHVVFGYVQDLQFVDDLTIGANMNRAGSLSLNGVSFQARFDF